MTPENENIEPEIPDEDTGDSEGMTLFVPASSDYPAGAFGKQGNSGEASISYVVESEDESGCNLRVTKVTPSGTEAPQDSGEALDNFARANANKTPTGY